MESLSQFQQNINTLSVFIFKCQTFLDPLIMAKALPDDISSKLSAPDLSELISSATTQLQLISQTIEPLVKQLCQSTKNFNKGSMKPYAPFIIDEPPLILNETHKQLSIDEIQATLTEPIKPIIRRFPLDYEGSCPSCNAGNNFIYKHSKTRYRCKGCSVTFSIHTTYHDEIRHRCPHCVHSLELVTERSDYSVLKCTNDNCPFFLKNKSLLKNDMAEHLKTNTNRHKLRYIFRIFDFTLAQVSSLSHKTINSKIDLSKIHHSHYTLGLILTYYINYGLSSRKTAQILREVHDLKISHQTVVNYAEAAAAIVETLNIKHPYELSSHITFDETYVKVKGKNHYVFFGSDTTNKIVTSYRIFENRSTKESVITLNETFNKYPKLPKNLTVITDGNPIYNAAQVFFSINDIEFDLYQVIGVKNKDEVSLMYRPYKQAEERLNRTFKQNYYGTNGYGSLRNANVYMSLYVAYFNFLRTHSSLGYKTPVTIDEVVKESLMPNKWLSLLQHTLNQYCDNVENTC